MEAVLARHPRKGARRHYDAAVGAYENPLGIRDRVQRAGGRRRSDPAL